VWAEVWRQALYAGLIVVTVAALWPWGIMGAAIAVLAATIVVTVLMHDLLCRATPMTWTDVLVPQIPAVVCSAAVAAALDVARSLVDRRSLSVWLSLSVLVLTAAVVFVAFLALAPYRPVRDLVDEVVEDVWPALRGFLRFNNPRPAKERAT
jgi:Polysaccharide biosynthesis C-terminal domain